MLESTVGNVDVRNHSERSCGSHTGRRSSDGRQSTSLTRETLYRPLEAAKGEIRVLQLHATHDSQGRIQCSLFTIALGNEHSAGDEGKASQYKALSYEWGPSHILCEIQVNGRLVHVRKNLWQFLDFYRTHRSNTTYLWIDQISIDQENGSERNSQVAQMSHIYLQAVEVIAWLGLAEEDDLRVMRWLQHTIASRADPLQQLMLSTSASPPANPRRSRASWFKIAESTDIRHAQPASQQQQQQQQQRLPELIRKTYWTRLWIVQEIVLARHLTFHLGAFEFDRAALKVYVEALLRIHRAVNAQSLGVHDGTIFDHIRSLADLKLHASNRAASRNVVSHETLRPARGPDSLLPLEYVLANLTQLGHCELKVDRIYGLQGLVTASHRIPVDYALPFAEVLGRLIDALVAAWQYAVGKATCKFLWEQGRDGDVAERWWKSLYEAGGDEAGFFKRLRVIQCAFAELQWQAADPRDQTIEDVQSFLRARTTPRNLTLRLDRDVQKNM